MGSLAPKDASKGGIGIQEGDVRVVGAKYAIYQLNPSKETGEQLEPFPALVMNLQLLADGKADGDPDEHFWRLGSPGKFAPSEDGEEAVGEDKGDEGPFFVPMKNGKVDANGVMPNERSGVMVLANSLLQCGFKESVLEKGDARDFIGMEGHVTQKKFSGGGRIKDYSTTVFDKLTVRPYEQKGKGKGKAAAAEETPAKRKAKDEDEGSGNGMDLDAAKEKLAKILKKVLPKVKEADETTVEQLKKMVRARIILDPEDEKEAIFKIFDEDLGELGEAVGFVVKKGKVIAED